MTPLVIDLYCGLGGWAEGFLAEGYRVIGFDIERHDYGTGGYPGQLVLQDVCTLHGSQFTNAAVIVASPPCQAYSYRAMPWKRAKALPPPDNSLFDACFRIQREACEAADQHIPLIVENVKGAQPWVGRAKWHFGSYYLWGDLPALMPTTFRRKTHSGSWDRTRRNYNPDHSFDIKNNGGSWFAIAHNTESGHSRNPVTGEEGLKVPGIKLSEVGFNVAAAQRYREGSKGGGDWFGSGENCSLQRRQSSRSNSRKAASAMIAKIPFPLSNHIAKCFKGVGE